MVRDLRKSDERYKKGEKRKNRTSKKKLRKK